MLFLHPFFTIIVLIENKRGTCKAPPRGESPEKRPEHERGLEFFLVGQ